jgi:DNA replication protein DnaC
MEIDIDRNDKKSFFESFTSPSTQTPTQIIFYGVPGSGKSHSIKKELAEKGITDLKEQTKRVVFHPEYTNADFVGQILPQSSDGGK